MNSSAVTLGTEPKIETTTIDIFGQAEQAVAKFAENVVVIQLPRVKCRAHYEESATRTPGSKGIRGAILELVLTGEDLMVMKKFDATLDKMAAEIGKKYHPCLNGNAFTGSFIKVKNPQALKQLYGLGDFANKFVSVAVIVTPYEVPFKLADGKTMQMVGYSFRLADTASISVV